MLGGKGELRTRVARTLVVSGLLVCALVQPAPLRCQGTGVNTIHGRVVGPGGKPLEAKVQLRNQAGYVVDLVFTDAEGGFTFQSVSDGVYHVFVDDERYQRGEATARVAANLYPIAEVFIALEPRSRPTASSPGGTGGSHVISAAELSKRYPKRARQEYAKGNKKMEHGDVKGAIACFERAVALAPNMSPALNNLGNAYLQVQRPADAEAAFRKALTADPDDPGSYVNLGHAYYEMKKYDQAEDYLSRGLQRDPGAALAYFFLGLTEMRTGEKVAGERNLQKALDLNDPDVAVAHLVLANLYLETHRAAQAREQLEGFLKARPQDPQAEHVREVLARLKAESP